MKSYGLKMSGEFFIDAIDEKPPWTEAYVGRFIYAENTDSYWLGGLKDWIQLGYGKSIIDEYSINFGFGYRQVNSQSIPFKHPIISGDNIFEALVSIASGHGIHDSTLFERHFALHQINASHINWSIVDGFVNASCIPVNSFFIDSTTPSVITLQDAITQLESNSIKISRVTVQSTAWVFAPAENLYRATIVVLPITTFPLIVQGYLDTGEMITPVKVELDSGTNRVHIWYKSAVLLRVVMVG